MQQTLRCRGQKRKGAPQRPLKPLQDFKQSQLRNLISWRFFYIIVHTICGLSTDNLLSSLNLSAAATIISNMSI